MKKNLFAILFLMIAGLQTPAWAQKVVVHLSTGQNVAYDVTLVDSISFDEMMAGEHRYVDLGLPSGTLWATCNVGAESPEGYGDYFAWGETQPKNLYNWNTYKYLDPDITSHLFLTKYCRNSVEGVADGKMVLEAMDDAAAAAWGNEWQMPSERQFEELISRQNTTTEWTTQNGVNGLLITSKANGSSIFLPAAGYRDDSGFDDMSSQSFGNVVLYWSRSLFMQTSEEAFSLFCFDSPNSNGAYLNCRSRSIGLAVRPVRYQEPVLVSSIVLSSESLVMQVGETAYLSATLEPQNVDNDFVTWESSDESVATVNSGGMVTAQGGGTCSIICRATDGSGVYAECQVSVTSPISSIRLSETWLNLVLDYSRTLTATVFPSNADNITLRWSSSDESIATVDANGTVSAQALGSCYVTCSATDGSGVEASCKVIVQNILGYQNGRKWVNLGLPSGALWSTCDVGVSNSDDYEKLGNYYAWGETEPKNSYNWSTYKWSEEGTQRSLTRYCPDASFGYNGYSDNLTELLPEDDAATVNFGEGWQTPSYDQFQELFDSDYTTWYFTEERGVKGVKIKSRTTSMTLFLPASGSFNSSEYWTRTVNAWPPYAMMYVGSETFPNQIATYYRYFGKRIRPVRENTQGPVPVGNIILNNEEVSLKVGESSGISVIVRAKVLPVFATNKEVTWECTDQNVLSLDENLIYRTLSPGTCYIICRATDGSGVTAKCRVTVSN